MIETAPTKSMARILGEDERIAWPEALASTAGFVGSDSWMEFVQKIYGFRAYRMAAQTGDSISGMLALCLVRHRIFGDYLTTAPFASYGGFAFSSSEACSALLDSARVLAHTIGARYVNVRFEGGDLTPPSGWLQHPIYATYRVNLHADPESLLASYSSDHRNHIRKSLKKGFSISFGHLDLLDDAFEVLSQSMHELGSPYHAKAYLRAMAEALGDTLEFAVLRGPRQELAGAGVFIGHGDVIANLHANVLRRFRTDHSGEYLYWSAIKHYGELGFRVFDLGRSLIGSGNDVFKSKWKPHKQLLAYWYALIMGATLPDLNQKSPRFQLAMSIWKRLPSFVVRPVGPLLINGLA